MYFYPLVVKKFIITNWALQSLVHLSGIYKSVRYLQVIEDKFCSIWYLAIFCATILCYSFFKKSTYFFDSCGLYCYRRYLHIFNIDRSYHHVCITSPTHSNTHYMTDDVPPSSYILHLLTTKDIHAGENKNYYVVSNSGLACSRNLID